VVGVLFILNTQHSRRLTLRTFIIHKGVVVKKTIYFLIIGIFIAAPYVVTAETYLKPGHPCYDIDPSNGGRDGHACWPKGEDPSVSVEASGERDVKGETPGLYSDTGKRHKGIDVSGEKDNKKNRVGERKRWLNGNTTNCAEGVNCKD
jgi:hypothetical protein